MAEIQDIIFRILIESDKRKQENERAKQEDEIEDEEAQHYDNDNEQEDELHLAVSELIGMLFRTQVEVSIGLVNALYQNLVFKALMANQSPSVKRFGVNIVNDMLEYIPVTLLGDDKFCKCVESLVTASSDKAWLVRQAACQGMGMFAEKHTLYF